VRRSAPARPMPPRSRPFRLHSTWLGVWCIAREHKAGVATVLRVKAEMAGADGAEPKCPKLMHQMMQEDGDIRVSRAILRKAETTSIRDHKTQKTLSSVTPHIPGEDSLADNSVCIWSEA
jgi:hypothetical protein